MTLITTAQQLNRADTINLEITRAKSQRVTEPISIAISDLTTTPESNITEMLETIHEAYASMTNTILYPAAEFR